MSRYEKDVKKKLKIKDFWLIQKIERSDIELFDPKRSINCGKTVNEIEKTWDCPCHGSRFDIDGNSIEGPSNYNIKYEE